MRSLPIALFASTMAVCASADIVTNDTLASITSPTTLSGVTNIIAKTQDVDISADLTLDNRTFLWLRGDSGTGYVNLAPTANDATLTIQGRSGFYTAYRFSGDSANADWTKVGIDELNKTTPAGHYCVRIGTPNGAAGSTGCGQIVIKTNPAFGYNAYGGFWARYLYVETSPKPGSDGYVDFLDIANGTLADISHIENRSTVYPARILFRGGTLLRNNATAVDAPLAPATGATLVLWSVNGAEIKLKKQFNEASFTTRKGRVRIVGTDLRLTNSGFVPQGVNGNNFFAWKLNTTDNVSWELSGNIIFAENMFMRTGDDDVLPYGSGTGGLVLEYNSAIKEANIATQVPYCCLDLYGTRQHLNSVTSTGSGFQIGVVSNSASATATLVLGAGNVNASLNAKCTARVAVVKDGTGTLTVKNTTAEDLTVSSGTASFTGTCAFTNLTAAANTVLDGAVTVRTLLTLGSGVAGESLNLALDENASVSVDGSVNLSTLTRNGASVAAGVYAAATTDWLASGTVTVLCAARAEVADISWTGAGETDSASLAANWSDGEGAFTLPRGRPVFATAGTQAVVDSGVAHFMGAKFQAAGDFTLTTNGPSDAVCLYGSLDVTRPETEDATVAHAYTVAAPLRLCASQTLSLATNMTVALTGGTTATAAFGFTMAGVKLGTGTYDYNDSGSLVLVNPRISGAITHKLGGGWMTLRGDVGNPGDTMALDLDYVRYRNGKDSSGGLMFGALTRLENATIWKPVTIGGQGQVGGISDRWFIGAANTTNVFKELVKCVPSTAICGEANTVFVFEQGAWVTGGGFNPKSMDNSKPATFIFNGPVKMDAGHRQFNPASNSRIVFNSTGNYSKLCVQSSGATYDFNVADAFDDTGFMCDATAAKFNIGTTHQKMAWLISGTISTANNYWVADNSSQIKRGTIIGSYPSAVEITRGAPNEDACSVTNCGVQFSGWVKLEKSGTGWHRMLPMAYTSYGDVEVSGGTLLFDAGATWLNGTNVIVKGTGTLKLGSAKTFQDFCTVSAEGEGWTLDLTGNQKAFEFYVDGKKMPGGVYSATASSLKSHFAGTGALIVRQAGTLLVIR